jgi:hypothetical protein
MYPKGITSICNLVTATVEARPLQTKVYTRSTLIVHLSLLAHELVLVDETVCVVAGFCRVCFVAVGV